MSSEKGRTFSQLKWKDRLRIEKMTKEKKSKAEIARTLRVDYTTIMWEINRGLTVQRDTNLVEREVYCAETAERKYQENLRAKGPDLKIGNDHELARYIEDKIADDGYSPEAALDKIKEDNIIVCTMSGRPGVICSLYERQRKIKLISWREHRYVQGKEVKPGEKGRNSS